MLILIVYPIDYIYITDIEIVIDAGDFIHVDAGGVIVAPIVGTVSSMLNANSFSVATFPTLSVAKNLIFLIPNNN